MKNETIEVLETPVNAESIKDVAAKAAVVAIVGVAVTQLATYLLHKAAKRFQKTPLTLVNTEK